MGSNQTKTMSTKAGNNDIIEKVICQESDLKENEMKAFSLEDEKILLVRQGGQFYAVGNKCTHYGAPLDTGALGNGRVRCPWHGACFNITTGDIEDFPGLDSLPCYKVDVQKDGGVKIQAKRSQLKNLRQKSMTTMDPNESTTFLVVGGGPAGQVCVETLRQDGFRGKIIMLSAETVRPYDRIKVSKALSSPPCEIALRPADFYETNGIDLRLGVELVQLKTAEKEAHLSTGDKIKYDSIFLATGSRPRAVCAPGNNLKNIFVLRTVHQGNEIAKKINDKHVLIVGASFIGMEGAAYCLEKAKSVTVIGRGSVPFGPVLGEKIGERLMKLFQEKGVEFRMGLDAKEYLPSEQDPSSVGQVKLSNDDVLPVDVVIVGIGTVPNTSYLKDSGVETTKFGTVPVDEFLTTNVPNVFAGGDIAEAPVLGQRASIGHWQLASYHGRIAGMNMLGRKVPLKTVPYFWTMLFGKGIRYSGYAPGYDDIVLHGNLEELKFIAYFCKGESVMAIATCGSDPVAAQYAELLAAGNSLTKQMIKDDPVEWTKSFKPT